MITKTVVEANMDTFEFGYFADDGTCDFFPITQKNMDEMVKKYGCSPELIELLLDNFELLKDFLLDDLRDIWKEVNK